MDIVKKSNNESVELALNINNNQISFAEIEMSLTLSVVLKKSTIRSAFKEKEGIAFTTITTIVQRFIDSFGFSTKLNSNQIEMITIDAFEHFTYESLEDIILFFKMARSGKFGATNRGVDSNLIFGDWFPKYMEQKSIAREKSIQKEKIDQSTDKRGASKEDVLKYYEKQEDKTRIQECKKHCHKITRDMSRDQLEVEISKWENDDYYKDFVKYLKPYRRIVNK
jgi:hypothetical protein